MPTTQTRRARPTPPPPPPTSFRERHPRATVLVPVGLALAVLLTMVVIKLAGNSTPPSNASVPVAGHQTSTGAIGTTTLPAGVLADVTAVSSETLSKIGLPLGLASPSKVSGNPAPLTANGKPEVLYIGAEYCPFCAAERWGAVEALSRFGTFSGLSATHSSTTDSYPDTKTFSFYGSTYSSPYLNFVPVEEFTNQPSGSGYSVLQVPTKAEQSILTSLDVSPYTSEPGSIPFIDIGGHYLFIGASYNPKLLAGKSMAQIASQLNTPSSEVAEAIDGTANEMTADICTTTGDQPAAVCDTPTISAITKSLGA